MRTLKELQNTKIFLENKKENLKKLRQVAINSETKIQITTEIRDYNIKITQIDNILENHNPNEFNKLLNADMLLFRQKYPTITSADMQTFILAWKECLKHFEDTEF